MYELGDIFKKNLFESFFAFSFTFSDEQVVKETFTFRYEFWNLPKYCDIVHSNAFSKAVRLILSRKFRLVVFSLKLRNLQATIERKLFLMSD